MAIPKIPPILTISDWNKNKGAIAKAVGETGITAAIKDMAAAYNDIEWDSVDIQKAVKVGDTAQRAAEAMAQAEDEFKKLPWLASKIEAVEKQARLTQTKFAKNKLIPAASTQHVGKLAAAAKQFDAQVKMVEAEHEAFEKAFAAKLDQEPMVKEITGERWFADLARITFHKNPFVLRWAVWPDVAKCADSHLAGLDHRFDPVGYQAEYKEALKVFTTNFQELTAMKNERMERSRAIGELEDRLEVIERELTHGLGGPSTMPWIMDILSRQDKQYCEFWLEQHAGVMEESKKASEAIDRDRMIPGSLRRQVRMLKGR